MPEGDACLLDSNILLRISKCDDPQHLAISHALHVLVGQRARLCYTSQTLGEFWNASTRPLEKNGFGLSVAATDRLARVIERDFELLPDSRDVHERSPRQACWGRRASVRMRGGHNTQLVRCSA